MQTARRILDMLTALIILTTAVYVEVVFADILSGAVQWTVGMAAATGIAVQCKMAWNPDSQVQVVSGPSGASR